MNRRPPRVGRILPRRRLLPRLPPNRLPPRRLPPNRLPPRRPPPRRQPPPLYLQPAPLDGINVNNLQFCSLIFRLPYLLLDYLHQLYIKPHRDVILQTIIFVCSLLLLVRFICYLFLEAYTNRCSVKGCKQKELMKILCTDCRHNYCLRHRHPQDHECEGKQSASTSAALTRRGKTNASSSSGARYNAGNKSHSSTSRPAATSKPQRTMMSSMGSELNRVRQQRQAQHQNMTEDEQMALALQRSLNENQAALTQEEMDLQLAQQLQHEETARTRRVAEQQRRRREEDESSSSCNIV